MRRSEMSGRKPVILLYTKVEQVVSCDLRLCSIECLHGPVRIEHLQRVMDRVSGENCPFAGALQQARHMADGMPHGLDQGQAIGDASPLLDKVRETSLHNWLNAFGVNARVVSL